MSYSVEANFKINGNQKALDLLNLAIRDQFLMSFEDREVGTINKDDMSIFIMEDGSGLEEVLMIMNKTLHIFEKYGFDNCSIEVDGCECLEPGSYIEFEIKNVLIRAIQFDVEDYDDEDEFDEKETEAQNQLQGLGFMDVDEFITANEIELDEELMTIDDMEESIKKIVEA